MNRLLFRHGEVIALFVGTTAVWMNYYSGEGIPGLLAAGVSTGALVFLYGLAKQTEVISADIDGDE